MIGFDYGKTACVMLVAITLGLNGSGVFAQVAGASIAAKQSSAQQPQPIKVFGEKPVPPKADAQPEVSKIVINIPSRTLWVYSGNRIIRYFPVGVGKPGFMTPVGKYAVIHKIIDPGWEHPYLPQGRVRIAPGSGNPLGTRWIGFHEYKGGEFGMHGTDRPSSVGQFSSHGCVRMKIPDAEALFEMVDVGTPVEVVYETVLIRSKGDEVRIIAYPDVFRRGMPSAEKVVSDIREQYPSAKVEVEKIKNALLRPSQQPVVVGLLVNGVSSDSDKPPITSESSSSKVEPLKIKVLPENQSSEEGKQKEAPPPHLEPMLEPGN